MSDTSGSGFGKFVPGFEFLQNLAGQAAGGIGEGISKNIPQLPNLGHWVAPTVNVEDLEKRIEELKAVHFWLDQNSKALGATIQALEVQKMTLATLQTMNFSFGDVANALKLKAHDTLASLSGAAPAAAAQEEEAPAQPNPFPGLEIPARTYSTAAVPAKKPAPRKPAARSAASAPKGGVVDPVQWWSALTDQFQAIATNAMKDVAKQSALDTTRQVASGLTGAAVKTATDVAGSVGRNLTGTVARNVGLAAGAGKAVTGRARSALGKKPAPPAKAPAAAPRASTKLTGAEWPMPGSFFPGMPGFGVAAAEPARKAAGQSAKPVKKTKPKARARPVKAAARKTSTARKPAAAKKTTARRR